MKAIKFFAIGLLWFTPCMHSMWEALDCELSQQLNSEAEAKRMLGHDPFIRVLTEKDPRVTKSDCKTLYFHGFGGNGAAARLVKKHYGSERLPGDVVTFDFADANNDSGMDTHNSNLGQLPDVKTGLYVLRKLYEHGEQRVGLNGHSRGGATVVNLIGVLQDQTGKYDQELEGIGVNPLARQAIFSMIKKGFIVLECPLTEVRSVIQHGVEEVCSSTSSSSPEWLISLTRFIGSWFPQASRDAVEAVSTSVADTSTRSVATSIDYAAPVVLRQYRPWAEQALDSAKKWNQANIPTIVHFQEKDMVLGNKNDKAFFERLRQSNGECTCVHRGKDGGDGHNSSFKSFAPSRNAFLQRYGASHIPHVAQLAELTNQLD